jgi:hypothetical protein
LSACAVPLILLDLVAVTKFFYSSL